MKQLFVAATRQNDGKTMVSLGLFNEFRKRFKKTAYMKPVGQQYLLVDGKKIDKDAVLIYKTYRLKDAISDMSPIAIPRGFTEEFIHSGTNPQVLQDQMMAAQARLIRNKQFVLYEGTGHAGVGSVFNLSNATVARVLGTKVVLVALGGIGSFIDEIMLNKAQFDLMGVEVIGVIMNKVRPDKYDKVKSLVEIALAEKGIRLLGAIPMEQSLSWPPVRELVDEVDATLLGGESGLSNLVQKFIIGDQIPHDAIDHFSKNTLLIVPGNREEVILTALLGHTMDPNRADTVSAIIFTNGIRPHRKILNLLKRAEIPLLLVEEDSFSVASKINHMILKMRAEDAEKIATAQHLIEKYVDVDVLCHLL
ncbi:MAG: AAA family ATPase [Candidatus Margulisiibacteriota bacterium]